MTVLALFIYMFLFTVVHGAMENCIHPSFWDHLMYIVLLVIIGAFAVFELVIIWTAF
jgi:hypothetical protein